MFPTRDVHKLTLGVAHFLGVLDGVLDDCVVEGAAGAALDGERAAKALRCHRGTTALPPHSAETLLYEQSVICSISTCCFRVKDMGRWERGEMGKFVFFAGKNGMCYQALPKGSPTARNSNG